MAESSTVADAPGRPPNIVMILADDLGYECLACNGALQHQTPHLDRLAAEGQRFTHCYSQPVCTPSRVQLLTGKYNFRNYEQFGKLRTDQITIANLLKSAGYVTGIVGKWQLGGDSTTVRDFGFDHHCLWHLDGRDSRYWNPRIVRDGVRAEGLETSFGPDIFCDDALAFMADHAQQPFFLLVSEVLTHAPYVETPETMTEQSAASRAAPRDEESDPRHFPAMLRYLDKNVGRIVRQLELLKLRERTLILFLADNGCTHEIETVVRAGIQKGGKGTMLDSGCHVPLIANWPGTIPAGRVTDALVDFCDFVPTLTDVAQIPHLPRDQAWDGVSLLPLFKGDSNASRSWIFCHYRRDALPPAPEDHESRRTLVLAETQPREAKRMGRYARNHHYKLYDDGRFYHVAQDPGETVEIDPARASDDGKEAWRLLQAVHLSMPAWRSW